MSSVGAVLVLGEFLPHDDEAAFLDACDDWLAEMYFHGLSL